MSYTEKLRDPRWQKKRLEVFERDEFTCKLCGDTDTELHVHHKTYNNGCEPWEYDMDNFISYCKHCHQVVEDLKKRGPDDIPIIVAKSITASHEDVLSVTAIIKSPDYGMNMSLYLYHIPSNKLTHKLFISEKKCKDFLYLFELAKKL